MNRVPALVPALLMAVGALGAHLAAAPKSQAAIAVNVAGLGCTTTVGTDSFEARSWSWGAENVISAPGGGGGAGKATVSALSLVRQSDACSPVLLANVVTGRHLQTLSLTQYDAAGVVTATVLLNDVTITDWKIGGTSATAQSSEEVSVSFERFTFTDAASGNRFCYDIPTAKSC